VGGGPTKLFNDKEIMGSPPVLAGRSPLRQPGAAEIVLARDRLKRYYTYR